MAKSKRKAFRIAHAFTLPGGRRYRPTDYHLAKTRSEEELLGKAQFAYELEDGAPAPIPAPPPKAVAADTPTDPAHEDPKTDEPDWSYMTIALMRAWLDKASVSLPASRASKSTHEDLCRDAWTAGRRPNPLYGFPGGPEPSPGMPGPASTDPILFAQAIELANAGGFPVPEESTAALEALTAPPAAPEPVASPADDQDDQEGTGEDASAPLDADTSEPSGSSNDASTATPEALMDEILDGAEPSGPDAVADPPLCEGCPNVATHEDAEGVPLCQTCWDAFAPAPSDGDPVAADSESTEAAATPTE